MQGGRTYLDRPISIVRDLDSNPLAAVVDHDAFVLDYDSTGKSVLSVCRRFVCCE